MDLRTIINNDAAASVQKFPTAQHSPSSPQQPQGHDLGSVYPVKKHDDASPVSYHTTQQAPQAPEFRAKPPQPPPLQPPLPLRSPGGSSPYGSTASPYQHTPALSSAAQHSQSASILPHSIQTYQPVSRDNYPPGSAGSAYNQSAGSLSSPYTPQAMSSGTPQSYFSQQRSQSVHSIQTPTSSQSYSYPPRESIGASQHQPIPQQSQPFSPNQQLSHPGTPLGPPSASFSRPSPHQARPPSSGFDSQQNRSLSGPWSSQDNQLRDQRDAGSPIVQAVHSQGPGGESQTRYSMRTEENNTPQPYRKDDDDTTSKNNSNSAVHVPGHAHDAGDTIPSQYPPSTPKTPQPASNSRPPTTSPPTKRLRQSEPPTSKTNSQRQLATEDSMNRLILPSEIPKKRPRRYDEPPVYARKAPRTSGNPPAIPTGLNVPPPPKRVVTSHEPQPDKFTSRDRPLHSQPHPILEAPNDEAPTNGNLPSRPPPPIDQNATSLGPWEPSITGLIPHEEVTKLICDFLFQQVVMRRDIGAGPAGGSVVGQGAVLEVEAKLGMLVDRNRGERVRIPALTECVLAKDDPSIRVGFESSMSLAQHRALNDFLNDTVKSSVSQSGTRIPLTYAHKKERDTFYQISSSALPPIIQHHLNPRHKPKVRVTTDQRTGAVLARIIKCRIADLDVYSPRTCLDWRISVNLEMNYEGDISELSLPDEPSSLVGAGAGAPRGGARNKDRMSYRHLAYQIDLTQVATTEDCSNNSQSEFEHELEIEISSAEVRRQGDLALAGDPKNQYEELIKGFVDNIRVLTRAVPER
ncbi:conserved hypothetical protein [Histoplasma capsulatum G186AR]|uniref:mRNA-capping enzyme subunit beta n=2 Tax=Ajellomyces capsulatus TaxID=5037 RepID=C0NMI5_AJECG|nr:uncharacterized protein HCBG_03962 [Histoplasma capsulatum G186AR]EEH07083.1 conserved hypothetical protein [Histoplasma capsulatum G186AR]KAG5287797.1 mRNA capping nucleoside-triphosphatase [Histoplasma capsulatum]QSS70376.1 mRNA capping nucleoside-triphosphatase [Histoplasma capsulatum G186AR]